MNLILATKSIRGRKKGARQKYYYYSHYLFLVLVVGENLAGETTLIPSHPSP
jgi:hypothetical protein